MKSKHILSAAFLTFGIVVSSLAQSDNNIEEIKKTVDKIFVNQPLWSINSKC